MRDGTRDTKVMRGMGCMRGDTRGYKRYEGYERFTQCIGCMVYRVHAVDVWCIK